jgi:hypothetical protein
MGMADQAGIAARVRKVAGNMHTYLLSIFFSPPA